MANIKLHEDDYLALYNMYLQETSVAAKNALHQILENARIADEEKRPLCQDTGFVTVFLEIGQNVCITGDNINDVCNKAVADAYKDYYFRKSMVSDSVFERINTTDNTPILIHTKIISGDKINVIVSVKGGGCENVSTTKMLNPAQGIDGIEEFVVETVKNANSKPCPPIKVGIGIGSNFEGSAILSKKALLNIVDNNSMYKQLEERLLQKINDLNIGVMGLGGRSTCFGVNILSEACHIASLPVSVSISCHSSRYASAVITADEITYKQQNYDFKKLTATDNSPETIYTTEVEKIRNLQSGVSVKLSGKVYTARDAAHKKFHELIQKGEQLPFDVKNAIIFYAGPCPASENEVIGPIGPTTSVRMDKYTQELYEMGLLATIGKGNRSSITRNDISKYKGKYFTITGGVASLLKSCIKSSKLIAYPELGAEAVLELEVEKLPVMVNI